jgi:hypothetical protein
MARFFAWLLPLLRNPLVRAVCYFSTTLIPFPEIDAIFVWGLFDLPPCPEREMGLRLQPVWVNRNHEAAVVGSNQCGEMQLLYLYEYKGLMYFASAGVDRGRLQVGRDSGNAPHQVLAIVL